jgi:hypothetical protein
MLDLAHTDAMHTDRAPTNAPADDSVRAPIAIA